jgi:hypothetical protein
MARLVIFTRSDQRPPELGPGDMFYLDRRFLTGSDDNEHYSARHPPVVFHGADGWYVNNETLNQPLYLWSPSGRLDTIDPGLAKRLEEGESDLQIADCEVTFLVQGSDADRHSPPIPRGPITWTPESEAEDALKQLMRDRPPFRIIMYTRFQEYITPRPHGQVGPALVKRPAPLTATDTAACCGPGVTAGTVHEASRMIRKITGLELWRIGDWMVKCGILRPEHNIDIPHTACSHRRPSLSW